MNGLRRPRIAEGLLVAIPLVLCSMAGCETTPTASADPQVNELLRKAADFIEAEKKFKLVIDVEMVLEAQGKKVEVKNAYLLSAQRPDRLAMRLKEGDNGVTLVTDGKQFWRAIPAMKKYMVGEAPASMDEVFKDQSAAVMGMGIGGAFFDALISENAYDRLTVRVAATRDLGSEEIDGKPCQHLRFEQLEYDWDTWIETGAQPLVRKAAFEVKKLPGSGNEALPGVKLSLAYVLKDWDLDPKFADDEFVFDPPADWQKVDRLFGEGDEEEPPHPLLGKPAPDFELAKRGGGKVDLAAYKGKDVVILDFWATWCGPCVRALPTIAKVAAKYRDRGVVFYAVDLEESPEDVAQFLKEQQLDIPVLFDSDNAVAKLYKVSGIPQTVLIGKDGTVQVVHVGLLPDLEKRLSGELDDLLAGKDLAGEAQASLQKAQGDVEGMSRAWSHDGAWSGAAPATAEEAVFALALGGKLIKIDAKGDNLSEATIADSAPLLRAAHLTGEKTTELLTFQVWGSTVKAHMASGKHLWSYEEGQGVDDVCAADLNGDGLDEVIVGYNGGTGLHVLDNQGKLLWKNTELGNVWHVTAGNVDGDALPEVISTSAEGKVHIFDGAGKHLRDLDPGIYANMVRACPSGADRQAFDLIVVGGKGETKEELVALDSEGNKRWSLAMTTNVASATSCRTKPWIAVAIADGTVHIIDASSGTEIAHAAAQGKQAEVAWLTPADGEPMAIVATGRELNAYGISAEKP